MRQSRLSGSVEGVMGNHDSYSDWFTHFVLDRAGQQQILDNSRLLGALSFVGFCCSCCFLPKNKSPGRASEPDYLKDWKMRIMLRNVSSCSAVAIFRDLPRRAVGKCA